MADTKVASFDMKSIPMWNPNMLEPGSTIAMIGARKAGKLSSFYHNVLAPCQHTRIAVMAPGSLEDAYFKYKGIVPQSCISLGYDEQKILEILKFQGNVARDIAAQVSDEHNQNMEKLRDYRKTWEIQTVRGLLLNASHENWSMETLMLKQAEEKKRLNEKEATIKESFEMQLSFKEAKLRKEATACVILDGGGAALDTYSEKTGFLQLMNNGRCYLSTTCIMVQRSSDLPHLTLGSLDWTVLFYESRRKELVELWKHHASVFACSLSLKEAMEYAQSKDCALAIRRNHKNPTFQNSVFLWPRKRMPVNPPPVIVSTRFGDNDPFFCAPTRKQAVETI